MSHFYPWYNQEADYQTNAKSYMDYLARTNQFMKVLVEDYEVFKELLLEEFKQFQHDTTKTIDQFNDRLDNIKQEMTDFFLVWLEDGTLEEIINVNIFNGKLDKSEFEAFLNENALKMTNLNETVTNLNETVTNHISKDTTDKERINTLIYDNSSQNVTRVQGVKYIAHRGASGFAPENTLPAFYKAKEYGYWGTECDIRLTSDGEWVLVHDNTVDRTTNGSGPVSNMTLSQIKNLTVTDGANIVLYPDLKIPTLDEFLQVCKKTGLFPIIEIKQSNTPPSAYQKIIDKLIQYGLIHRSGMISFDIDQMQALRDLNDYIHMFPILSVTPENIRRVKELGNATMNIQASSLTEETIRNIHAQGLLVCGWTINNVEDGNRFINRGLDFVITDVLQKQWGDVFQ